MDRQKHTAFGETIRETGRKVDQYSETLASKSDELLDKGKQVKNALGDEIDHYSEEVVTYIKKNPVKSALIAAGIGLLIGKLFKS